MKILKRCSFYFITNFIGRKYFLFIFIAVTFIVNGFFISQVEAEVITENFQVVSGTDASGDTISSFNETEIGKLSTVDGSRIQSNGSSWPKTGSYNEEKYIEFVFTPEIPINSTIEDVSITHNFRRSGALEATKLEIWDGNNFIDQNIFKCQSTGIDCEETIDITSYINTPELINNLKVRFLAYRIGDANTKTSHDFIGLTVTYQEEIIEPAFFTEVTDDILEDTYWIKSESPYVIKSIINVEEGATLFIEEGVIIKFDVDGGLIIDGDVEAQGTDINPIYFTSNFDDSLGGDTNADRDYTSPYKGDWGSIIIQSAGSQSILNNVVERYSGGGLILLDGGAVSSNGFDSDNEIVAFGSDSDFNNLKTTSISIYDSSIFSIENAIINDVNYYGSNSFLSIYKGSSISLSNSKIEGINNNIIDIYENSEATFENVEILVESGRDTTAISVYDDSNLNIDNSNFVYNYSGFSVYNNSFISINNSTINTGGDGISVFNNSTCSLNKTSFTAGDDGIVAFNDSFLNISDGDISSISDGLVIFNNTNANVDHTKISNGGNSGVTSFSDTLPNTINITKSEITNNNYGFIIFDSVINIYENSIHDNLLNGVANFDLIDLDFTNNYWGDKSGPIHTSNPTGAGDIITDNVLFIPFLLEDPLLIKKRDPVILIPGIMGSKLIKDYGDKDEIWPNVPKLLLSFFDNYLRDLELLPNGDKNLDYPLVIGDIVRETPTSNIFSGLISLMITDSEYIEGTDLFIFPYDWRLSNKDNATLLKEKVDQILIDTGADKIDIIAHSMGGLVTKSYILNYGKEKIDQLMFLGTPHLGSPKVFKALMYGDDMGTNFGFLSLLNPNIVKDISQNMPSIFELLPSNKYINNIGKYFSSGGVNMDFSQTKDYMIMEGRNEIMFSYTEDLHNSLDDLDLSGIDVYNFANCDKYTIGKIDNFKKEKKNLFGTYFEDDYRLSYTAGDETVPFESANGEDYGTKYFTTGISHTELSSFLGIRESIISILKNETPNTFENISTVYSDLSCKISGKVPSVHSPASMDIYDEFGNHTGPNEEGDIEYNIPGVAYDIIGDKKFAFLPDGGDYKVVTKALDLGSYDFYIDSFNQNEEKVGEVSFLSIPLSSLNTQATTDINPDITEYKINLDSNGDGEVESVLAPGDYTPINKTNRSSGYIKNNQSLIINSNDPDDLKPNLLVREDIKNDFDKKEIKKIVNDLVIEEIKSKNITKNEERIVQPNNLSASVGLLNLDRRFIILFVVLLSSVILLYSIKLIFKIK